MSIHELREISQYNKKLQKFYDSLKPKKVYHEKYEIPYLVWDEEQVPNELFPEGNKKDMGAKVWYASDKGDTWLIDGFDDTSFKIRKNKEIKWVYRNEIIYDPSVKKK